MGALFITQVWRYLNQVSPYIFLFGLICILWVQWRLWQKDKALLARVKSTPPLPALETWPRLPRVSVLVAAWNEADNIERHIQSFMDLR